MGQLPRYPTTVDTVSSNHVPWIIIGISLLPCIILLFFIRVLLARENKQRDEEPPDKSIADIYVTKIDEEGNSVEVKVSKVGVHPYWETYTTD